MRSRGEYGMPVEIQSPRTIELGQERLLCWQCLDLVEESTLHRVTHVREHLWVDGKRKFTLSCTCARILSCKNQMWINDGSEWSQHRYKISSLLRHISGAPEAINPLTAKLVNLNFHPLELNLCLADAIHNFKWVKIIKIWQNGGQLFSNIAGWKHVQKVIHNVLIKNENPNICGTGG